MKAIICGFHGADDDKIISSLALKYGNDLTILISSTQANLTGIKKKQKYNFHDLAYGTVKDADLKNMGPLDTKIIEEMSEPQSIYMRMLDRLEIKRGHKLPYDERRQLFEIDLRIMNHILSQGKIDLCIFDYVPHLGFDYLLYELCRHKGIRVVMQCYSLAIAGRTVSRYFLNDIKNPLPKLEQVYDNPDFNGLTDRMKAYIDYYRRDKEDIISFVTIEVFQKKQSKIVKYLKSTIRMLKMRDKRLIPAAKLRIKEIFYLKDIKKYIKNSSQNPQPNERYLYFPLHYQPECTSSPMGFEYANQFLAINLISTLLPEDVVLYVKPHPNPSLTTRKQFYQRVAACRQVHLLPFEANTYDLIDNSLAVVTLTGTAGWEAVVREKPVLMFGHYFYQYAPGVYQVESIEDCKSALDRIIKGEFEFDLKRLEMFLDQLSLYLVDGYLGNDFESIYKIGKEENVQNTINGYIDFVEDPENWL